MPADARFHPRVRPRLAFGRAGPAADAAPAPQVRGRRQPSPARRRERRSTRGRHVAVAATVVIIAGLTLLSFFDDARPHGRQSATPCMVRLRGYQWWWEVTYLDGRPDDVITTANEIARPRGPARADPARSAGRDPFVLGPEPRRQEGSDPRPRQRDHDHRRPARHLSGTMRRILRPAARAHGLPRRRRSARTPSRPGRHAQRQPGAEPADAGGGRAAGACSSQSPAPPATRSRARRPPARSDPTSPMSASRRYIAAGRIADHARLARGLDRRPADHQARQQHAHGAAQRRRTAGRLGLHGEPPMTRAGDRARHARHRGRAGARRAPAGPDAGARRAASGAR